VLDSDVADEVVRLSAGHPYFIQEHGGPPGPRLR
jgi:hypothetical protein